MNAEEQRIHKIQQDRIEWWRRQDQASVSWRLALARAHREQEIRLQASYYEAMREAARREAARRAAA